MLWPKGKIYADGAERWDEFVALLQAGISGARNGALAGSAPKIMLHIDRGGDNAGSRYFFDHIFDRGVEFDFIGLSFYPWWHGPVSSLAENLYDLARRYGRDIILAEIAYPWTLDNHDQSPNIVTQDTVLQSDYPATIDGQLSFLLSLRSLLEQIPAGRGAGLMYWEPAWLPDVGWEPGDGSPWDNLTLFGPDGEALPSIQWPHDAAS
jgi:arabinogalactan endo-1,4-beta-galactosidase